MAQSAEHILGKDEVPGSNPGISSRLNILVAFICGEVFLCSKIGSLSSLSIVGVRKIEKLRQRVRFKNPLIIFIRNCAKWCDIS